MRGRFVWRQFMRTGLVVALAIGGFASRSSATTIIVDTLADNADPGFVGGGACGRGTVAELPGADGHISLREAIAAANHTAGPHLITFLESLRGGSIRVGFDAGGNALPRELPWLCGGDVTIDGDVDDDGAPDITLVAGDLEPSAVGLQIVSDRNQVLGLGFEGFPSVALRIGGAGVSVSGNRLNRNAIHASATGIELNADSASQAGAGLLVDTIVSRNVIDSSDPGDGIVVNVGPAADSAVQRLVISENQVTDAVRFGIALILGDAPESAETNVLEAVIRSNSVVGSGREGIAVRASSGRSHAARGIEITSNQVRDSGGAGIALGNVCGTADSVVEATVSRNQVTGNGRVLRLPGIALLGGSNFDCLSESTPASEQNRLTATVDGNTLSRNGGGHLVVSGGQVGGNDNMVAVTLTDNVAADGLVGIAIVGGQGTYEGRTMASNGNSVRAALSNNDVEMTLGGILVAGGNGGPSSDNRIELIMETNRSCMNTVSDISCVGAFPGAVGFPPNIGSGNVVSGVIRASEATVLIADPGLEGNLCTATLEDNRACGAPTPTPTVVAPRCVGDCDVSGEVTVNELILMVNVGLGILPPASCLPGDANRDGLITVDEIVTAVNRALMGC